MSYCRWSSVCEDRFESDLYIYDHIGGFISVNVAAKRRKGVENAPDFDDFNDTDEPDTIVAQYLARQKWKKDHEAELVLEKIDAPYAGTSHEFLSPQTCVAFLVELKALGYHMPDRVLRPSTYEDC